MRQRNLLRNLLGLSILAAVMFVSQAAVSAQTQVQELLLPFSAGVIEIQADETYSGDIVHPSIGPIAFDFTDIRRDVDTPVLAIGDGRVRVECVHTSGSAVLQFQADGYAGNFYYVHLDGNELAAGISDAWSQVERGEFIGRLFPSALESGPQDACAQFSTGPHLHLDFPRNGMEIDGVTFNSFGPNDGDQISSTNRRPGERTEATCAGLDATIVGTSGDDVLQGTEGRDVIAGLRGDDTIRGLGGNDVICGGKGADTILGNNGADIIMGGKGADALVAASGSRESIINGVLVDLRNDTVGGDRLFGGSGKDAIFGSNQADRIRGGSGSDSLAGFDGDDWIRGEKGEDFIDGGSNDDDLHGGNGSDAIVAGAGDTVTGGAGSNDVCEFSTQPEAVQGCENLVRP